MFYIYDKALAKRQQQEAAKREAARYYGYGYDMADCQVRQSQQANQCMFSEVFHPYEDLIAANNELQKRNKELRDEAAGHSAKLAAKVAAAYANARDQINDLGDRLYAMASDRDDWIRKCRIAEVTVEAFEAELKKNINKPKNHA